MLHHGDLLPDQSLDALEKEKRVVKEQEEKRARAMQRALAERARAKRAEHAAALAGESAPGVDGTFGFHRWRAALDDPSMFDECLAPLPAWTPNTPEVKPDLLRTSPAPWTVIVRGPVESLRRICETKPDNAPVKFLEKMAAAACARIGLCVEQKAGCARVRVHDPGTPGEPLSFWFPLEALGTLPSQVRSIRTHWTTHRPVSTFDRVGPFSTDR
jgi:chromodomain-helicase-DNA-binding protein 4